MVRRLAALLSSKNHWMDLAGARDVCECFTNPKDDSTSLNCGEFIPESRERGTAPLSWPARSSAETAPDLSLDDL